MASLRANIPAGGKPGQVIKKKTYVDFDVYWADDKTGGGSSEELEQKIDGLENNVSELQTKVSTAESDIDNLETSKQNKITGTKGQLVGFDENGDPVAEDFEYNGEGGVSDHRLLSNRDADGQHPISAITGLESQLQSIKKDVSNAVTAEDELSILDIIKIMEES